MSQLTSPPSVIIAGTTSPLDPTPPFSKHHQWSQKAHPPSSLLSPESPPSSNSIPVLSQLPPPDLSVTFLTPRLDRLRPHLWLAGRKGHIRALHHHLMLRRSLVITEDPDMHMVWYEHTIFLKPLPPYLLDYDFWAERLCVDDDGQSRTSRSVRPRFTESSDGHHLISRRRGAGKEKGGSDGGHSDNARRSTEKRPDDISAGYEIYAAALGFLRSYVALIIHESDHHIALSHKLIPPVSYPAWQLIAQDVLDFVHGFPPDSSEAGSFPMSASHSSTAASLSDSSPDPTTSSPPSLAVNGPIPTQRSLAPFPPSPSPAIIPTTMSIPVSPRYMYGELRLARLNFITKFTGRGYSHFYLYTDYSSYLGRSFRGLVVCWAYLGVLLAAMEVVTNGWGGNRVSSSISGSFKSGIADGIGGDMGGQTGDGQWVVDWCVRFAITVIVFVFLIVVGIGSLVGGLVVWHAWNTWRAWRRWEGEERKEGKKHLA